MGVRLNNCKGITKGVEAPPHNSVECGKIQRLSYVPGIIRGQGPPDFARPAQVPEVVQRMRYMSSPFGTRFEVGEEDVALALEPAPYAHRR
jgi:hypothetical protein